jgi:hypothetical protein
LHVIKAGTEITFDYSTSSTDSMDEWKMACLCGSINCRKEISGYHYLNDGVKKRYEDIGVIPKYLRGST